jgi:DNA-binding beta-propeller fold protein YncE
VIAGFVSRASSQIGAFRLVQGWYEANKGLVGLEQDVHDGEQGRLLSGLARLMKQLDLTQIPASAIRDVVMPSGLVSEKEIISLLLLRAVQLEGSISHHFHWVHPHKVLEVDMEFGRRGSGTGEMARPGGICISKDGRIFLADGANHRVQAFDLRGRFLFSLGSEGHGVGQLQRPRDVCLTKDDDIVVADTGNHRIQIFRRDQTIAVVGMGQGNELGQMNKPSGVAVLKDGKLVVADSDNHRIQIFNQDGSVHNCFGRAGTQEGEFKEPRAVAINSQDEILVGDTNNHRIQVFDCKGQLKRCFGKLGNNNSEFRMPRKIAIAPYDDFVVADKINNRIQVFTSDGTFVQSYTGGDTDNFNAPVGVAVGPEGRVYVTQFGNDRVTVLVARRKDVTPCQP